jgi:hypothetical protein
MLETTVSSSLRHVLLALREPEEFAVLWRTGERRYPLPVWGALAATALLGTATYGLVMGLAGNAPGAFGSSALLTVAAGLAWVIPLPGLYVLNSLTGSRLSAASTLLAALVTVSWGALAMLASVPIHWFFAAAIPRPFVVWAVNLVIFAGIGTCMLDVFGRVMEALEPGRGRSPTWLLVPVAMIGTELIFAFDLFRFGHS